MKRNLYIGAAVVAVLVALGARSLVLEKRSAVDAAGVQAPQFEVDLMWPKPLPNHWLLGMTIGVSVDAQDHIWIVHRQGSLERMETYAQQDPVAGDCCFAAPPVLEFDEAGNLIGHWGGPGAGYDWPVSLHGITVDYKGNVWIGGNGNGAGGSAPLFATPGDPEGHVGPGPYHDSMVLKFTPDGKFLMQIGKAGQSKGSNDVENLRGPAKTWVDPKTNELYVADGYGNKRVIVFDADTGKYKRHWGAYGHRPDDADPGPYNPDAPINQQFRSPVHCAVLSSDNLLYVCDRVNDRIQVFRPDGTYLKEKTFYPKTRGDGAIWDLAFSKDPQEKYLYASDGTNEKIHILDRETLEVLTSFGDGGRQPGQFYAVHSIATDSKGNLFTTETYRGQRLQKFVYKGVGPVTTLDQGVLWPKAAK
jgi:DNA-binding beta-propeller fold protein YncE